MVQLRSFRLTFSATVHILPRGISGVSRPQGKLNGKQIMFLGFDEKIG